jgi:hypothetical protein
MFDFVDSHRLWFFVKNISKTEKLPFWLFSKASKGPVVSYERNGKEPVIDYKGVYFSFRENPLLFIISSSSNFFGTVIMKPDNRPDNHWWSVSLSEDWPTLVLATHYPTNNCCYQTLLVNSKA